MKKFALAIILLVPALRSASGLETATPRNLSEFSLLNVYSVAQDRVGAIWLSTTRGIYRYNGHALDKLYDEVPSNCLSYGGGRSMLVNDRGKLLRFDIYDLSSTVLDCPGPALAEGDSVVVCPALPDGERALSIVRLSDGRLLAGTDKAGLWDVSGVPRLTRRCRGPVGTIYESSGGRILLGYASGGFSIFEGENERFHSECEGKNFTNVRSFCDFNGRIYIGDAGGLYSLGDDGSIRGETVAGMDGCPVFCLFRDSASDIWIGTYHNGVRLAYSDDFPFRRTGSGLGGLMINGMCENGLGDLLVFTDGQGVRSLGLADGSVGFVTGLPYAKYQGAYFDRESGIIWAGVFHEGILSYEPRSGKHSMVRFRDGTVGSITPILRCGDELLIGCAHGLYAFNPSSERDISRRIPGTEGLIYSLCRAPDGTVWASGDGVWVFKNGRLEEAFTEIASILHGEGGNCYGSSFTAGGGVWLALARKGVLHIEGGKRTLFTRDDYGIQDDFTYAIHELTEGNMLVSTATGVSVIGRSVHNYPTVRADATVRLDNGRLFLAGRDGVWEVIWNNAEKNDPCSVRVDHVYLNGERFCGDEMKHNSGVVSFDISSFEYSGPSTLKFESKLEGFDRNWLKCYQESPVQYRGLPPGKYTFRVRAVDGDGRQVAEDSVFLRIKPAWYATVLARTLFSAAILAMICFIFFSMRARRSLSDELRKKEMENREKTRFLIDLSYSIRTPINLIIGKIERYFKDFGARSAGSENIEDIYKRSQELRDMVSEFVDSKMEAVIEDKSALKDSRFFNAAIGAVERNLFSPELDVGLLCEEMHLGKTMLTKRLKDSCGMTPRVFIEDVKLKHAAKMLRDGSQRVSEIADLLCFCSVKHFEERFRLKFGCNPRDYR